MTDWDYKCAVCGAETDRDCHHLITRSRLATRFEPNNLILLCPKHHKFDSKLSAHGAPLAFADWLEKEKPHLYDWVRLHNNDMVRSSIQWYQEQLERLQALVDETGYQH